MGDQMSKTFMWHDDGLSRAVLVTDEPIEHKIVLGAANDAHWIEIALSPADAERIADELKAHASAMRRA